MNDISKLLKVHTFRILFGFLCVCASVDCCLPCLTVNVVLLLFCLDTKSKTTESLSFASIVLAEQIFFSRFSFSTFKRIPDQCLFFPVLCIFFFRAFSSSSSPHTFALPFGTPTHSSVRGKKNPHSSHTHTTTAEWSPNEILLKRVCFLLGAKTIHDPVQ